MTGAQVLAVGVGGAVAAYAVRGIWESARARRVTAKPAKAQGLDSPVRRVVELPGEMRMTVTDKKSVTVPEPAGDYAAPVGSLPFTVTIQKAAAENDIPTPVLTELLNQESRFRGDIITGKVKSRVGAAGIAQFMPATAQERGINPLDPDLAIPGAAKYVADLRRKFSGSLVKALAAYNWGQGNVARKGLHRAPKETRDYVARILGAARKDSEVQRRLDYDPSRMWFYSLLPDGRGESR